MLPNAHVILCNGAADRRRGSSWQSATRLPLATFGPQKNVRLKITDLTDRMASRLPDRVHDLMELAALVYAADQSCRRFGGKTIDYGDKWYRAFRFVIPVRDLAFWSHSKVTETLVETLRFLTDDEYEFAFTKMDVRPQFQDYLDFRTRSKDPDPVERVLLFSGGLDSLTGVVEEVITHRHRVALVSHKPVDHLAKKQRELVAEISNRAKDPKLRPVHFPVLANRIQSPDGDPTQRSRSFLYASMAAAVAHYFRIDDIYFYENGIVSINLPLCGQEIGGRATRTTHPQAMAGFGQLFSAVTDSQFRVHNEYLWDTKEDVLRRLCNAGHRDLARNTLSCSHTRQFTLKAPHCGMCSQCLSRRVAALGADCQDDDPATGYRADAICDHRKKDEDRIMGERFVGDARRVEKMNSVLLFHQAYAGELGRVYPYLGMSPTLGAEKLFDLHLRHAKQVAVVMASEMKNHVEARRTGVLADTSVVNYAFDAEQVSLPRRSEEVSLAEFKAEVKRLGKTQKEIIQSLFEKHVIGANVATKPTQEVLAGWVGAKFNTTFKNALAAAVQAGFIDNEKHSGGRGGYFLTPKGEKAAEILELS